MDAHTHVASQEVTSVTSITSKEKVLILKLRNKGKSQVKWTQDTVNNEHMMKKSSKLCCIYHKSKKFGESDSDESETDSDEENDDGKARPRRSVEEREKSRKLTNMKRFHA